MNTKAKRLAGLIAACGATAGVGGLTAPAMAQPTVVNISGATLLENFFKTRASTVDYIDADGNGVARGFPTSTNQQLAPFGLPDPFPNNQVWPPEIEWAVMYSAVGSTNGFQELINFGRSFVTVPGTNSDGNVSLRISVRTAAYYNRYKFINAGTANDDNDPQFPPAVGLIFNQNNPMGAPIRSETTFIDWPTNTIPNPDAFLAMYTSTAVASSAPNEGLTDVGGLTIDIAPLDVPTTWAVTQTGTPGFDFNPLVVGYGNNSRQAVDKDGGTSAAGNRSNRLATLTGGANLFNPAVTPDANTIFDTQLLIAPVAPVVSFGTGISQIDMTDLRHLFSTGRRPTGENLMVVTRDSGSGTRNAWDNSLGLDPSWGVGDNTGVRNNATINDALGSSYLPSNKGGNNRVEPSVINHRLGIGYVGPERGVDAAWLTGGQMEIASVRNNLPSYGGTQFVRPTINNVLDNGTNGWVIFGPAVLATFGDPESAPPEKGGLGWLELFDDTNSNGNYDLGEPFNDRNGNGIRDAVEPRPGSLPPAMRNVEAAAYINNIERSVAAFSELPGSDQTVFTPGEIAATTYVLLGAMDNVKQSSPTIDPTVLVPNPALNQSLQDFIRTQAGNVLANPAYAAYGNSVAPVNPSNSRAGKVPNRAIAAGVYSDQSLVPGGDSYITEGGATLNYGTNLPLRNLISGDFNGDGLRNIDDAFDIIGAWRKRSGLPGWVAPAGSGALAALAAQIGTTVSGSDLSIEVMGDFDGNGSFNTADVRFWADGLAIATSGPHTGQLDRKAAFIILDSTVGAGNFFGTTIAGGAPYSAGDSRADIAGPSGRQARGFAPVGADGVIDQFDLDYVRAQFIGNPFVTDGEATWSDLSEAVGFDLSADINGDLVVNQADVDEVLIMLGEDCPPDFNNDHIVNSQDFFDFLAAFFSSLPSADYNNDTFINSQDFFDFLNDFFTGC